MKVHIEDTCTACGLCVDTCPEVFQMGTDKAEVIVDEVPAEFEDAVAAGRRRVSSGSNYNRIA